MEPEGFHDFMMAYGYQGRDFPEIVGRYKGKQLVICADAACVWDDLERLGCKRPAGNATRGSVTGPYDFMTVNKLVEVFPGNIEHAYSNEPTLLMKFIDARRQEYRKEFSGPNNTHACMKGAKWHWPFGGHATSGWGAALVGVALGYDKVILCGMPLEDGPHNGEPPWRRCTFTREAASTVDGQINSHWKKARDLAFKGKVKSMSGRTKEWLGSP